MSRHRVLVYVKPGCHLCDDACAVVAKVCAELGVGWETQDILDDDALVQQWGEYVPVVLVDGQVHDWFRVQDARLRAALG